MVKKKFSFVITLWWVLLLGFLGGMIIWLAPKEERLSEVENRNLAGAPSLSVESVLEGEFMSGVERFLADGFFERGKLIETSSEFKNVFNIKSTEELMEANMEEAVNEFMEEAEAINIEEGTSDELNEVNESAAEISLSEVNTGNLSQNSDDTEYTFWFDFTDGSTRTVYTYPTENLEISINALNAYRDALPEDGQLHFFQIPYGYLANLIIYDEQNKYAGWGCNAEDYLIEHAAEGVYIHNGTDILEPYLLEGEELYYRTDYHWSALGAYYGHAGMMENMGLPHLEYDDYQYMVHKNFIGANYSTNPSPEIRAKADTLEVMYPVFPIESYKIENLTEQSEAPFNQYSLNSYLAYLGGTIGPWRRFVTGADTGRNCLIVTDSFGNSFAPYMMAYYDEVHMVDLRSAYFSFYKSGGYTVREYLEYYGIDDAYIMLSTSSSMNSGYMMHSLMRYLDE